ncbi:thioredoxin domain-containing protein [Desulfosporosinus sp. PR]|uniref:thioredoxin domain-containing protein n=1 Tax=Candidatus Desulfosporosinus nitrosoreducens TaxID=3401928 RepID=UPI0027EEEEC8|nr:thioredoxin domain-containing protein [Desulfosporosinus sp. PR]MDQ7096611.1 thioredoxin domain-containing protein [Desulfosporosinus sp. PR]
MSVKPILQPGIPAPEFTLPAINRKSEEINSRHPAEVSVFVFFGSEMTGPITAQLGDYQERLKDYEVKKARLIGISNASGDALENLAEEKQLTFPILHSDLTGGPAYSYGVVDGGQILPVVFVVDPEGVIRRVFDPDPAEGLPNPAMVLRAITNLSNAPKPPVIAADDWRLGPADAPIVLIEYGDYQCSHCRDLFNVVKDLMPIYKDKLQFIFRHFPMRHAHPLAIMAAQAAEAAGIQGKFWEMHARMFAADNDLETEKLRVYAQEIGLDPERFSADLTSPAVESAVMDEYREATKHKIKSPPTLFVNSILFDGAHTLENLGHKVAGLLSCLD